MSQVDLHSHSTISDGSFTPGQVVHKAAGAGLDAIALTDHDNIDGLAEATRAAKSEGILLVPGVEISAEFPTGTLHILGYFINRNDKTLKEKLDTLQEARAQRNPKIAEKLQGLGIDITYDEVQAVAGSTQVGRPNFAQILIQKGVVKNFNEAFEKYLGKDKPAYVDKFRYSPEDAIEMINNAGGVAVLAHAFTLNLNDSGLKTFVASLADMGLKGMEIYYPEHDTDTIYRYEAIAAAFHLVKTGGSDFHGNNKEGSTLGDCGPKGCPELDTVEKLRTLSKQPA